MKKYFIFTTIVFGLIVAQQLLHMDMTKNAGTALRLPDHVFNLQISNIRYFHNDCHGTCTRKH